MPGPITEPLIKFYNASIHEDRWLAVLFRSIPFFSILTLFIVVQFLAYFEKISFLVICAILNIGMWLWITSMALYSVKGSYQTSIEIDEELEKTPGAAEVQRQKMEQPGAPLNVVIIPNYEEKEEILTTTLRCLSEAVGATEMWIVLAMEKREAEVRKKADRLATCFRSCFKRILITEHPAKDESGYPLVQEHLDGSTHPEIPGKASNMKFAVQQVYDVVRQDGDSSKAERTIITVADSDVLFHPSYFAKVNEEYTILKNRGGGIENWTLWQAPQLPYRNYYESPAPSRAWGYVYTFYEYGGVTGLSAGAHHMLFSAYSIPLQLAMMANPWFPEPVQDAGGLNNAEKGGPTGSAGESAGTVWDGDILAEDHHAYLKSWFYSCWHSATLVQMAEKSQGCRPNLRVRPVMLPTKATSIIEENYWQSWKARWAQAVRHCMGVAEIPYTMMVFWYMAGALPRKCYNMKFIWQNFVVFSRLWIMQLVPIWHFIAITKLTVYWLFHSRHLPQCPDRIWAVTNERFLLCGMAGAWALTWPVIIPFFLCALSSFCFIMVVFERPKEKAEQRVQEHKDPYVKVWYAADSETPPTCGSKALTVLMRISFDFVFLISPIMIVYGVFAMIVACWNVARSGNQIKYVSAAKALSMAAAQESYGSVDSNSVKTIDSDRIKEESN